MKKLLLILLIASASCTKEKQCYECSFGVVNGYQRPNEVYCGPMPHNFKDAQGNDLNSFCYPK